MIYLIRSLLYLACGFLTIGLVLYCSRNTDIEVLWDLESNMELDPLVRILAVLFWPIVMAALVINAGYSVLDGFIKEKH